METIKKIVDVGINDNKDFEYNSMPSGNPVSKTGGQLTIQLSIISSVLLFFCHL